MNDADVGKQVQQMVRFILQEADEKASEITVAAEEVRAAYSPSIVFKSQIANLVLHPFSIHFLFFYDHQINDRLDGVRLHAGVQHREAAAGGVRETAGEAGVRAQGEAGRRPQEDVSRSTRPIHSFRFLVSLMQREISPSLSLIARCW